MIGQETIDRVRDATSLVGLIGEGVKLTRRGRSFVGLCPFHKEKTPSFHVNEERGFYHCFGCGAHGDAIRFLQEVEGLAFHDAVKQLAERTGITIAETSSEAERRGEESARRRLQELYDANAAAAAFFERMLREHPLRALAEAELARRGLVPQAPTDAVADALQAFRIGYAPYGWDGLVRQLRDPSTLQVAEKVGLVVARKGGGGFYDRFRHRLMFAVIDLQGRVVAFSGRVLPEPTPEELAGAGLESMGGGGDRDAKYVNSSESPIYRKREAVFGLYQARQEVRQAEACVLVEGNFDVLGLHARGVKNVAAPLGTAFTAEQARLVKRFAPGVTFLFDGDRAGRTAVGRSREACREAGLMARVASLPDGIDPDDLARRSGPEAIRKVIGAAKGMIEYLIDAAFEELRDTTDAQLRAARIREVGQLLAGEDDPTVRALAEQHADGVVARLGVSDARTFRALSQAVRDAAMAGPAGAGSGRADPGDRTPETGRASVRATSPYTARSRDRRDEVAHEVLGAFLDYPALFADPEVTTGLSLLEEDVALAVGAAHAAWETRPSGEDPNGPRRFAEQILAKLSGPIQKFAAARLAAPRNERLEDARSELLVNLEKLRTFELARQRTEVVEELQRAQATGDHEQELELLRQRQQALKPRAKELWRRARERDAEEWSSPTTGSPPEGETRSES